MIPVGQLVYLKGGGIARVFGNYGHHVGIEMLGKVMPKHVWVDEKDVVYPGSDEEERARG